jgi:hypothetical protein
MSPTATRRRAGRPPAPAVAESPGVAPQAPEPEPAASPFPEASPQARRLAAAILEVLAGTQLPSEAARGLGLSQARYYQLELRAVAGLVAACEARRRGRGQPAGTDLAALRRECERLRRECARQQALVRAARRAVGLTPGAAAPPAEPAGRKRRRPTARALKMAALLQPPEAAPAGAPVATEAAPPAEAAPGSP